MEDYQPHTYLPNIDEIVPNLMCLWRLIGEQTKQEDRIQVAKQLEQLPYNIKSTIFALHQMEFYSKCCATNAKTVPDKLNHRAYVNDGYRDLLTYALDSFLIAGRRTQDSITRWISRVPEPMSVPKSLHKLVKSISKGNSNINESLSSVVTSYWENGGSLLKDYRDLTQHTALAPSEVHLFLSHLGQIHVSIEIPNNPNVESVRKLDFRETRPALPFMHGAAFALIMFANLIVEFSIELLNPGRDPIESRKESAIVLFTRGPIFMDQPSRGMAANAPSVISKITNDAIKQAHSVLKDNGVNLTEANEG